ncbi:hypothetical protein K3G63_13795 [Hymenobacter sp. HSC-4F20]|uniref:hypothetical protein n=1 Tax=Hymenobacter sp. HSC-4F20 TaxID=2864135 RepID=UPI001C737CF2|nr:hypothetical protein [Hymenobacter sp. HSC-4F20]MBX0291518.1 hypothetical protein [Hymenobacter sp. HSC-4F20]
MLPNQNHNEQWTGILLVLLLGVGLPRWYLTTLRRHRITLSKQEFILEEIPGVVINRQPLNTLVGWWVASSRGGASSKYLHFDFKGSGRIYILDKEYASFEQLVTYLQLHYAHKNFTGQR